MTTNKTITRGEVEAVFQAFGSGGWAVLRHSEMARGAPADHLGSHGAIRPFPAWDGIHVRSEDWHVILVADIEGGDASFTVRDAEEIMSKITVHFELDGVPLETTRTAIKRFLNPERFGVTEAYYFQEGRIMSPEELAVGPHTLSLTMSYGTGETYVDTIGFVVD